MSRPKQYLFCARRGSSHNHYFLALHEPMSQVTDLLNLSPSKAQAALDERQRRRQQERQQREQQHQLLGVARRAAPFVVHYVNHLGLFLTPTSRGCFTKIFKSSLRRSNWKYNDDGTWSMRCDHAGRKREIHALRTYCSANHLRFLIKTTPIDDFFSSEVLTACGLPTGFD
jgi:hypothetical protein